MVYDKCKYYLNKKNKVMKLTAFCRNKTDYAG
jgi:hypothetical protein